MGTEPLKLAWTAQVIFSWLKLSTTVKRNDFPAYTDRQHKAAGVSPFHHVSRCSAYDYSVPLELTLTSYRQRTFVVVFTAPCLGILFCHFYAGVGVSIADFLDFWKELAYNS